MGKKTMMTMMKKKMMISIVIFIHSIKCIQYGIHVVDWNRVVGIYSQAIV